jgi:hypothetical protein
MGVEDFSFLYTVLSSSYHIGTGYLGPFPGIKRLGPEAGSGAHKILYIVYSVFTGEIFPGS